MTKTIIFEEMKMVSGGTLLDGIIKLAGGKDTFFYIGDRVIYSVTGQHGSVTEVHYNYKWEEYLYTVKFDDGHEEGPIPERFLKAE